MNKIKSLAVICALLSLSLIIALAYTGCGGGGSGSSDSKNTVTIKGALTGGTHYSIKQLNFFDRFFAGLLARPLYALAAEDIAKVIAFNHNGGYVIAELDETGAFSLRVDKGNPTALVFIDADDNYLGYLTLGNGIDSLPLGKISGGTIDLQALSSSGLIVEPLHNPIGSELPLSAEEIAAIAQGDDYFAAVIKNMDVNDNGTIDLLENKFYRPFIMYFVNGGVFGDNLTPTPSIPADFNSYRFNISIYEQGVSDFPGTVTFEGPGGSGLIGQTNDVAPHTEPGNALYGAPAIASPTIPPAGAYTVTYNAAPLVFNIPAQTAAISNIVMAIPTVTLSGGAIQKIDWAYKLGNGAAAAIDPTTIIEYISIQINGSGTQYDPDYLQGYSRLYNSANFAPATLTHTLPVKSSSGASWSIPWNNVSHISMVYNDIFGNHYVVNWDRSE
jgi:hypothetical protein